MAYLIERRAYELYLASGCQKNRDLENWLQAELEFTTATKATMPPAEGVSKWLLDTVASLYSNTRLRLLAESRGLNIVSVAWEDTARTKGSCWGPNISDMTLAVTNSAGTRGSPVAMPIIRRPNFADVTTDCELDMFNVVVGNENGFGKITLPFRKYLEEITDFTNNPFIGKLLLPTEKILTSTQACILPLHEGSVEFHVQLYNYQSSATSPGVLVILASSEGTSACVVNGTQPLYFNKVGRAANFLAQRLSDDRRRRGVSVTGPMTTEEKNRNALFVFQIPLKHLKHLKRCANYEEEECGAGALFGDDDFESDECCRGIPESAECCVKRGLEKAVLGTTEGFADYEGTRGLSLERDERFPIRCTIQYYNVTDTADISEDTFIDMAELLSRAFVGGSSSLVLSNTNRSTEQML